MTKAEPKIAPPSPIKAHVNEAQTTIKATYQHYRHEIAHHRILSNLPPEYRTHLVHATDAINSTCRNAGVYLVPEDLVLILSASMLLPLSYVTLRWTYAFHLALHTYFVFIYPVLVSLYDAESGDVKSTGSDLAGWVLLSLWTVLERIVPNAVHGYRTLWYLILKCGLSYGLFNPRLDGASHLVRLVVRPTILPALGLGSEGRSEGAKKGQEEKETGAPSEEEDVLAMRSKDASVEECDASTQDSKESGFSFVEKSELEQEQEVEAEAKAEAEAEAKAEVEVEVEAEREEKNEVKETKTLHIKVESIMGTDWKYVEGTTEFEGPYLVFDVIGKRMEEVDFLPPSHSDFLTGKKVRTPTGTLEEEEEEEDEMKIEKEDEAFEADGVKGANKEEQADEPELAEEDEENEVEKKVDGPQGDNFPKDEKADSNVGQSEGATMSKDENKNEKADVSENVDDHKGGKNDETEEADDDDTKDEEDGSKKGNDGVAETKEEDVVDEAAKSPEKGKAEVLKEENDDSKINEKLAVDEDKASLTVEPEKAEKTKQTSASFAWPGSALMIPVVLNSRGKDGDDEDDNNDEKTKPQRLLRVAAYDKRSIGSDAFFGVAYAEALLTEGKAFKAETLSLKDGRSKDSDGGAMKVGEVSFTTSCT